METRTSSLELLAEKTFERLSSLVVDLTLIRSNYSPKEDLATIEGTLLKWFIGTAITLTSIAFAAARFIH